MSTINLGKIRFNWRGDWSSLGLYTANDIVRYNGDIYVLTDNVNGVDGWDPSKADLMVNGELPAFAEGSVITFDANGTMTEVAADSTAGKSLITDGTTIKWSENKIIGGKHLINLVEYPYTGGVWDSSNSGAWVPGLHVDYTPLSSTSKIKLHLEFTIGLSGGNGHIGHYMTYIGADNGLTGATGNYLQSNFTPLSGQTSEERVSMQIPCDSWGAGVEGRMGLYGRSYDASSWRSRFHGSYYWNGTTGQQYCAPIVYIEEWEEEA